jgi:hypothetical protein
MPSMLFSEYFFFKPLSGWCYCNSSHCCFSQL